LLWGPSEERRFAAVELDIAQESLRYVWHREDKFNAWSRLSSAFGRHDLTSTIAFDRSVLGALLEFVWLGRSLLESVFFGLGFSFLTTSFLIFAPSSKALELRGTSAVTSGGDSTGETGGASCCKLCISSRSAVSKVSGDTLTSIVSWSNGSVALVFVRDGVPSSMTVSVPRPTTMSPILIMILLFPNEDD
jgi:hypothetical protein